MAVYQHWFQEQMIRSDAPSTRRLGRAGLRIPGVEHTTVKELLDLPVIRSQLRQRLTDLRNEHAPDPARRSAELRTSLRELDATLSHLEHLGRTALELLDAANRASPGDHGTIDLSALEPVDRQISEAGGTDVVSFLLQDQIHRITQGFGSTSVAEQIQASRELYRGLIESCSFQRDRLRRTL